MKKGIFLSIISLVLSIFCFGCSKDVSDLVYENISEKVSTYFNATGDFCATISSGKRENPYTYNGISNTLKDFAVLTVVCDASSSSIEVELTINDDSFSTRLEIDNITGEYLTDLERLINEDDIVSIRYNNSTLNLECKSKDFKILCDEALHIGVNEFQTSLEKLVSKNNLLAEIYLRVLDSTSDDFKRTYWYFYIYAQNGTTYSCVIDTQTGDVIIKN